ncbi:arylsulfatase [Streptomyces sp. NPDC088789]|uniref:arylsulfatase n=1 Tax=Streptomyces sp. NPDC088789 TaxID=3365899 RepID=UPI003803F320
MLALLHTSPVHVPVFDALRDEDHPGLPLRHLVHEELLDRARREGPGAVAGEVRAAVEGAVRDGARAVLCTCSTLGSVAEGLGTAVPVLRVDRPMATAAIAAAMATAGPRGHALGDHAGHDGLSGRGGPAIPAVLVLATVESTLGPTVALVEEEARRAGRTVTVRSRLVDGAWDRFTAGDTEGCAQLVAAAADTVTDADAIVLAQASMAPAERLVTTALPVLSSPRPGLAAAVVATRPGERG